MSSIGFGFYRVNIQVGRCFFSEMGFKKRLTNVSFVYFCRFGIYGVDIGRVCVFLVKWALRNV